MYLMNFEVSRVIVCTGLKWGVFFKSLNFYITSIFSKAIHNILFISLFIYLFLSLYLSFSLSLPVSICLSLSLLLCLSSLPVCLSLSLYLSLNAKFSKHLDHLDLDTTSLIHILSATLNQRIR